MGMNIFRFAGDMSHLAGTLWLLKMARRGHTSGRIKILIVAVCYFFPIFFSVCILASFFFFFLVSHHHPDKFLFFVVVVVFFLILIRKLKF